jgi:hypothetical protein
MNAETGSFSGMVRAWRWRLRAILSFGIALGLFLTPGLAHVVGASPGVKDHEDSVLIFGDDLAVISGTGDLIPVDISRMTPKVPLYNFAGASLGITWGQFSAASATAQAKVSDHRTGTRTDVHLKLRGLVPRGVYSVFYTTFGPDSENPLCLGVDRSLALPSADTGQRPDAASFVADARGRAEFHGRVPGDLLAVTMLAYTVIYHADGQTYGPFANRSESESQGEPECRSSYGVDAIRQLLIFQKR